MSTTTHTWGDGLFITSGVENLEGSNQVRLVIEAPGERNVCDVYMGREEAICMAHALLSSATKLGADGGH